MASGSSKGFDFASDDILCSYEDYANQEESNSDSAIATNEFNKSRMARASAAAADQELAVERSMRKHTDNVMRFLEGLSSRLSQLEIYCHNLDKSIGEMRSDLTRDHGESDEKLKFLEKHLQEVHRWVQILRDKQELADTQKELARLQLAQKGSSSSQSSQLTTDDKKEHSAGPEPQAYYLPQPTMQPPQVYLPTPEPLPNSLQMQMTSYSTIGSNQPMTHSYGGQVRTPQPHLKPGFGTQPGDGYGSPNPYMVYDNSSSGRAQQGGDFYPPDLQQSGGGGGGVVSRPPQQQQQQPPQPSTRRNHHPYNEVIDKLMSMGCRGDHVMGVIRRLDETGQTVDFTAVLGRLNGQRGWSG